MTRIARASAATLLLAASSSALAATVTATFDDLPALPGLTGAAGLFYANANSALYDGVAWDANITVVGDQYRVDPGTPGPLFGVPTSGHYFVTNAASSVTLATTLVLTGAWFGPNEYYGYGRGADHITITALAGATALGSVGAQLYDPAAADPGVPGPMVFVDTSSFLGYTGITGYRIDEQGPNVYATNWVGDDFTFRNAVPEPLAPALVVAGLGMLAAAGRVRRR